MSKYSRIIFFALAFMLAWSFLNPRTETTTGDDIILDAKSKVVIGNAVTVEVLNNTESDISIPGNCPKNPLSVERYMNGEWALIEAESKTCETEEIMIEAGKKQEISYAAWSADLFDEVGRYRVTLEQNMDEKVKAYTTEVEITQPGIFRRFFREAFYKPIFNTLVYLISVIPNYSLGWAIIILTLIIKLILLVPNQKALKAQKQMQKVQPQLDALKKKYQDNPQKLTEETMKIWQKHKVNPMSSCLPMLIQFPVLIALFYVVKNGLDSVSPELLYGSLKGFDASMIEPVFLGIIDLTQVNFIVLPIIIGLLQFGQMRLTLGKNISKAPADSPMPMMNKGMMYFMPILIAFFTASLPAAVGFYWGTSTLFGIAQQIAVNKSKD